MPVKLSTTTQRPMCHSSCVQNRFDLTWRLFIQTERQHINSLSMPLYNFFIVLLHNDLFYGHLGKWICLLFWLHCHAQWHSGLVWFHILDLESFPFWVVNYSVLIILFSKHWMKRDSWYFVNDCSLFIFHWLNERNSIRSCLINITFWKLSCWNS